MLIGWATSLIVLPFSINCFVQGRYITGWLSAFLMFLAVLNSLFIYYKNRLAVSCWIFFIFNLLAVLFSISEVGVKALLWSYPFIFVVFFVQPRLPARILGTIAFLSLIALSAFLFEPATVARFVFTLLLLIIFCDAIVGVLMRMENKLSEQAIRDPLTDAYNRRYMNTCLENTIEETRRNFGPASLIQLDVDEFKKVNDRFGHIAGDTVLITLVDLLHKRQRKLDYVFRTGGEEFVLLLRNTSLEQAISLAENLRKSIEETEILKGQTITISLGVAEYQPGETDDEWLHRADKSLYEAKYDGRNCVRPIVNKN
jgi:diguanylate cyclase